MEQIRWFDRKFDFSYQENIFPSIIERLEGTHVRLVRKVEGVSEASMERRLEGSWSVKENIGHLTDLEPLWLGRLDDILDGREYLRSADLENKKTDLANHNQYSIVTLLARFEAYRNQIVRHLHDLQDKDVFRQARHPRLEEPMRIMDLFLFVAEHDDHHLARITELIRLG